MTVRTKCTLKQLALAGTAIALISQGSALAQEDKKIEFDIDAQELGDALNEFGVQSGKEVYYLETDIAGKQTKGVEGAYSADEAINLLLNSTGIPHSDNGSGTILIGEAYIQRASLGEGAADSSRFRVATLAQTDDSVTQVRSPRVDDEDDEETQDTIIVTGTSIRGIAPESSPTRTFDREDIQISGVATAQDFIQLLPQNFGGGANADIPGGLPNDNDVQFNNNRGGSFGSSVNLRGLGSGSTLVLLNGHRVAPSSGIGNFVDISMIPASAIERVEVLTDGASSIYGADAVAGVVNFILRDDFDGVEASFRYGTVTEGSMDEYRANLSAGKSWKSGNALVAYEYLNQDNLSAGDRSFSQASPLPNDLLPSQERHSVLASLSQELTSELDTFVDFNFAERMAMSDSTNVNTLSTFRNERLARSINAYAGGSWKVSNSWFLDFFGGYSKSFIASDSSTIDNPNMREIESDIWSGDVKASGDLFSLPGGVVKLAVGGHYRSEGLVNFDLDDDEIDRTADREVYALFGEAFIPIFGSQNAIPGIERLELNVSGRYSDFSDFGSTANPKVGILWSPIGSLKLRGSYSTSFNPPPLGRIGVADLTAQPLPTSFLNSALNLTPGDPSIADVVVLTAFGTDKNLDAERSRAFTAGLDFEATQDRHAFTVSATYFNIRFENRLGSTPIPDNRQFFDAPNIAFNNPELFPQGSIIFSPTQAQINDLVSSVDVLFPSPFGDDPFDAEIINFTQVTRNLSLTSVSGFDFDFGYDYEFDFGKLFVGVDGTYLQDFEQQGSVTSPVIDQLNTLFNPVDLRLRGRVSFSHGQFTANAFVNYVDSYREDNTPEAASVESWTTIDLNLAYNLQNRLRNEVLNNSSIRLSVINLFDQDPPTVPETNFSTFGFDATNASPLGRFVALEFTKRF